LNLWEGEEQVGNDSWLRLVRGHSEALLHIEKY